MLLTKTVKVKWYHLTKDWYISKGYTYTKYLDEFEVPINHLHKGASVLVEVQCDYCGSIIKKSYNDYIKQNVNTAIHRDACSSCKGLKQIETYQKLYGVNSPTQIPKVREKQNNTIKLKYGVNNISQSDEIKNKKMKTNLEKYGVPYYSQTEESKNKIKNTCLDKYGVEHHLQNKDILQKQIDTCQEKYGVDNVFQLEEIKLKSENTCVKKYGVKNISKDPIMMKIIRKKANMSLYKNNSAPTSRQQKYLYYLLKGELNFPVETSLLDIAFPKEKLYIEYDGSGHDLSVLCGNIEKQDFDRRQIKRVYGLKNKGWKMIRIISLKDLLPQDNIIIKMINEAKEYLNTNHSWIKFDIDNNRVVCSQFEKDYNFEKLRKITNRDIELISTQKIS